LRLFNDTFQRGSLVHAIAKAGSVRPSHSWRQSEFLRPNFMFLSVGVQTKRLC